MPTRAQLEDADLLEPRVSPLGEEVDELDDEDGEGDVEMIGEDTNGNGHASDHDADTNGRRGSSAEPE